MKLFLPLVLCLVALPCFGQEIDLGPQLGDAAIVSRVEATPLTQVEVRSDFHRSLVQAAHKMVRDGTLTRAKFVRLRVAMMSPAFRNYAEQLAVIQMAFSNSENVPMTPDGTVDRTAIDWDSLADFLERIIPLILDLIEQLIGLFG